MERKPKLVSGPLQPSSLGGTVEFRNVTFTYPSRPGHEVRSCQQGSFCKNESFDERRKVKVENSTSCEGDPKPQPEAQSWSGDGSSGRLRSRKEHTHTSPLEALRPEPGRHLR